jgi:hypothetical protein
MQIHPSVQPSTPRYVVRVSRVLTCASDRGTVQILSQPSPTAERELTIQHEDFATCRKCFGEAGHHLDSCPAVLQCL